MGLRLRTGPASSCKAALPEHYLSNREITETVNSLDKVVTFSLNRNFRFFEPLKRNCLKTETETYLHAFPYVQWHDSSEIIAQWV